MKKIIIFLIVIVLIFIGFKYLKTEKQPVTDSNPPLPSENANLLATSTQSYALSDVQTHNKAGDCWTTIRGKVYDLTTWPEKHPGGAEAILFICGIDGTEAFNKKHGGQAKAEATLEGFYIGELVQTP